jgi:hypothetical protein
MEKGLVKKLYLHNADHLKTNSQDLLAFVQQNGQQLHEEYSAMFEEYLDEVLHRIVPTLMTDFWVKLDEGFFPPLEERMLILQLQKIYEHQEFEDAIEKQDNSGNRLHEIANTLTRVDESTLPADEDYCPICQEKYSELNRFGLEESPCRFKACKHVMGWSCISEWLSDHDSCPICRHTILPLPDRECQNNRNYEDDRFDLDWFKQLDLNYSRNRSQQEQIEEEESGDEDGDEQEDWIITREEEEEEDDGDYFTQALDRVDLYLERRQAPREYILTN